VDAKGSTCCTPQCVLHYAWFLSVARQLFYVMLVGDCHCKYLCIKIERCDFLLISFMQADGMIFFVVSPVKYW
jgi:hypothetical protein